MPLQEFRSITETALDEKKTFDISYRLREHIHIACKAASVDAITDFAEKNPSIENPIVHPHAHSLTLFVGLS